MSKYDNHDHNAEPAYARPTLARKNANEKAGSWLAFAAMAVIALGAIAFFAGAFDDDGGEEVAGLATVEDEVAPVERRVVETENGVTTTAPRNELADEVAPTDGAAVVVPADGDRAAIVTPNGDGGTEVIDMPNLVKPKLATPGDAEYVGPVDDKTTVTTGTVSD